MLSEDASTQCPECRKPLIWLGHCRRECDEGSAEELRFGCGVCKREFDYADGQLSERRKRRDTYAELAAAIRSEYNAALNHRCPACGGPISDGRVGRKFACLWWGEEYAVEKGELVTKLEEDRLLKSKPRMSDFYAVQFKPKVR